MTLTDICKNYWHQQIFVKIIDTNRYLLKLLTPTDICKNYWHQQIFVKIIDTNIYLEHRGINITFLLELERLWTARTDRSSLTSCNNNKLFLDQQKYNCQYVFFNTKQQCHPSQIKHLGRMRPLISTFLTQCCSF